MSQIITHRVWPRRATLESLQAGGVLANKKLGAGEVILIGEGDSVNANGFGVFDSFIMGDGATVAGDLPVRSLNGDYTFASQADIDALFT